MSMISYLASSRELPVGGFCTAPDYVFNSYREYKASEIYVKPQNIGTSPQYDFISSVYDCIFPVEVYSSYDAQSSILLHEYSEVAPVTRIGPDLGKRSVPGAVHDRAILSQLVSHQFSLPYIYYLGMAYDERALRFFLCKHLKTGEKAELYRCWGMTESEERDKAWDQIVDLQQFVDKNDLKILETEYGAEEEKEFINYIAPRNNANGSEELLVSTPAVTIYLEGAFEVIPDEVFRMLGCKGKFDED